MVELKPHHFSPSVEFVGNSTPPRKIRMPVVLITEFARRQMEHLVDIGAVEVGWMGLAHRDGQNAVKIEEVFLVEQEVHATTTDMTTNGLAELLDRLFARDVNPEHLKFWGHSHVHMACEPSWQDEKQLEEFGLNGTGWFLRGIANKRGMIKFTLRDFDNGMKFTDVPWKEVPGDPLRAELERQFRVYVHQHGDLGGGARHYTRIGDSTPTKTRETEPPAEVASSGVAENVEGVTSTPRAKGDGESEDSASPPAASVSPPREIPLEQRTNPPFKVFPLKRWQRIWNAVCGWLYRIKPTAAPISNDDRTAATLAEKVSN